jgi:dTDP-4-amino-4,6-dideoxygalactose transaminase
MLGINSRLDEIQAAVLLVKLRHVEGWNASRRENAAYYDEALAGFDGIVTPRIGNGNVHTYHQYVIRAAERDDLMKHLRENGVGCEVYYPVPLHLQECFASLGGARGDLATAEGAAEEVLALPVHSELLRPEQEYVVGRIGEFVRGRTGRRGIR